MYFPSTRTENNEVYAIIEDYGHIWIRISDAEKEETWKDTDGKEILTFTNWRSGQPNNYDGDEHWGYMYSYDGKWYDDDDSYTVSSIVCELT